MSVALYLNAPRACFSRQELARALARRPLQCRLYDLLHFCRVSVFVESWTFPEHDAHIHTIPLSSDSYSLCSAPSALELCARAFEEFNPFLLAYEAVAVCIVLLKELLTFFLLIAAALEQLAHFLK